MTSKIAKNVYAQLVKKIEKRIHSAQYAALKAVNQELSALYIEIPSSVAKSAPLG